jgi:hypothetical protein
MATPINTIDGILKELNGQDKEGKPKKEPWVLFAGNFTVTEVTVTEFNKINQLPNGMALKAFFNEKTAEVKFYLLKSIETPEGALLP